MFNTYFYNTSLRSLIVAFGQLFANMQVIRLDDAGKQIANISVPISYGPKEKWFTRTTQDPDLTRNVMNILPRMAFSIVGLNYDSERKLNINNKLRFVATDSNKINSIPTPVPYNVAIKLDIMAKTNNDMFQIVEQILPYFGPHYNVTIKPLLNTDVVQDVPIILNDVTFDDTYAVDWDTERYILYTLMFTAKTVIYGGIAPSAIIKNVTANVHMGEKEIYNAYINPLDANIEDDYSIIENWFTENDIDKLFQ